MIQTVQTSMNSNNKKKQNNEVEMNRTQTQQSRITATIGGN